MSNIHQMKFSWFYDRNLLYFVDFHFSLFPRIQLTAGIDSCKGLVLYKQQFTAWGYYKPFFMYACHKESVIY